MYDTSNLVSTTVHSSSEFKKAHSNVAAFIADALTRGALTGIVDYHILDSSTGNVPPPKLDLVEKLEDFPCPSITAHDEGGWFAGKQLHGFDVK